MRAITPAWVIRGLLVAVAALGCTRGSTSGQVQQSQPDSGTTDAGSAYVRAACPALPPEQDGIQWQSGPAVSMVAPQSRGWTAVSSDSSCAQLEPRPPPPQFRFVADDRASCDVAVVAENGDVSVFALLATPGYGTFFAGADGSPGLYAASSLTQMISSIAPRARGFIGVHSAVRAGCDYSSIVLPPNVPVPPALHDSRDGNQIWQIQPNPLGGFVAVRTSVGYDASHPSYLELGWFDEDFQQVSAWHQATTWPEQANNDWTVTVDQLGRAFVLSLVYPKSLGGPPPNPNSWTFKARWLDIGGPIGPEFAPLAPIYTDPSGLPHFAGWDVLLPLHEGGVAAYHWPLTGPGSLTLSGWYAFYPSGGSSLVTAPSWLSSFDGSLRSVAHGKAYATVSADAQTCARTVQLISPQGVPCYSIELDDSRLCGGGDILQRDGTFLMQGRCAMRYWPRLADTP